MSEVNALLKKGEFELRKWVSNAPELTQKISSDSTEYSVIDIDKSDTVKTLGLRWSARADVFQFAVPSLSNDSRITKRSILSSIAKIFDPLGLIGPVITLAKIIMQRLWQLKLAWDESVPMDTYTSWFQFKKQLHSLNSIVIPRRLIICDKPTRLQLHGFCDASEQAYGACLYLRVSDGRQHFSRIICSKSRIAPIKSLSLPRLELCGAVLLARLLVKTIEALQLPLKEIYCWTDSTIVLSWISSSSRSWKTFVANRVSEIQELTDTSYWRHVSTLENPADLISRGRSPAELIDSSLWWHGPEWLLLDVQGWPSIPAPVNLEDVPERRLLVAAHTSSTERNEIFKKYSNFTKLTRVIAYCLRFIHNTNCTRNRSSSKLLKGVLSARELSVATICIIKGVQKECFSNEIRGLRNLKKLNARSNLLSLNPFLDEEGIMRVGGRLLNSNLLYNQKHPILLPKGHHVTKLIIKRTHIENFHSGVQTTLASIRACYWPISARNTIKEVIRQCVVCFKAKPISAKYVMAELPVNRLTPSRPFTNCGVDYFGPLLLREGKRRNSKITKAYGAIFICFAVKAIHIELVSDLSSAAFLNGLKRFIARRGKPLNIYSDNATNFIGANKEQAQLHETFSNQNKQAIISTMANKGITWHFIPPRSPHFGGIWEAAVKSSKQHLRRIVGQASLTFEETYTILVQIEAILNSRPLTPISNDPNDLSFLTPGHFLIGDSLTSINEPSLNHLPVNRLSRWQYIELIKQQFWKRWFKEYLSQLQQRTKWRVTSKPILVDQLVLLGEDNTPPFQWPVARVRELHPGADGITRAATVQTSKVIFKRTATKLYPLPIDNSDK